MPHNGNVKAGEEIVALVDAFGVSMPDDQREEISKITDEEAAKAYLSANLGDCMEPSKLMAQSVFSAWLTSKIEIQPLIFTTQLYCIEQAKKVLQDCDAQLNAPHKDHGTPISDEYAIGLQRTKVMALQCLSTLTSRASKLAQLVQPKKVKDKPRNAPPNVLTQININQPHNNGSVTLTADERKVS